MQISCLSEALLNQFMSYNTGGRGFAERATNYEREDIKLILSQKKIFQEELFSIDLDKVCL